MKIRCSLFLSLFLCILLLISLSDYVLAGEADTHFDKGTELLNNSQYDEAIKEYSTAMKIDPSYTYLCYYQIALCYECKENFDEAIKYYTDSMNYASSGEEKANSHLGLGYAYFGKGDYDRAIQEFGKALDLGTTYKYLCYSKLGEACEYKDSYSDAIQYYTQSLKESQDMYDLSASHFRIAYCNDELGNIEGAIEHYIKSNEYVPYPNTYYNLALDYERLGKNEDAIKCYQEYLKLDPQAPDRKDVEGYIASLKQDVQISSGNATSDDYIDKAWDCYYGGDYEEAIAMANKVLAKNPGDAEAHLIIGYCYDDQNLLDKALEEYKKVIELDPQNFYAFYYSGAIYFEQGNYKEAVPLFLKANDNAYSDEGKAYVGDYLGRSYYYLGEYAKSVEFYKKYTDYFPDDPIGHINLGDAYYSSGNNDKALEHYKKYLQLDPQGDYVSDVQSVVSSIQGGANLTTAMTADDYFDAGWNYEQGGNYEKAKESYFKALDIDPDHIYAHNNLGVLYMNIDKDYAKAAYHFLAALEVQPDYSYPIYNLALIYDIQERYEEALAKYKEFLQLEPNDPERADIEAIIASLEQQIGSAQSTPTPEPTAPVVAGNNPPVIEIVEPASLIGQKNLVIEETNPVVTTVRLVGVVCDDDEVVKVTVNGQPVELSIPSTRNTEVVTSKSINKYQFTALVGLSQGENVIEVKAWDGANNIGQAQVAINYNPETSVEVAGPVNTPLQKGEKWAVVIGIGKYQHSGINSLNYTVADAESIYKFLTTDGGFDADHVKLLTDDDATTKNIKSALGQFLSRKAMENDTVFIYYSGHGAPEPDPASTDGDGMSKYIVTYDSDPEDLYSTAFPMEEVRTIFQRIEAKKIVFFIDACYSGASGGKTFSKPGMKTGNVSEQFLDDMSEGEGRVVITASGTNEVSLETPELGHGVFTYYLLEGLKGGADMNSDKMITVDEVYEYLYEKVVKTSKDYGGGQHPMKKGESSGRFILIKF